MPITIERFLSRVLLPSTIGTNECWLWLGCKNSKGYGYFSFGKTVYAHRASYQIFVGVIPSGKLICHSCDCPSCVNPSHLFLGDYKTNYEDARAKGRNTQGVKNASAKLTPADVVHIRCLYLDGLSAAEIARQWNIHTTTAWEVATHRTWTHIED